MTQVAQVKTHMTETFTANEQNALALKKGSIVEYLNGELVWIRSTITKTTDFYVWFNGSGVVRVSRHTFINWPSMFRIVQA